MPPKTEQPAEKPAEGTTPDAPEAPPTVETGEVDALKARIAELEASQASEPSAEPAPELDPAQPVGRRPGWVTVRVLKAGDGKISTGEHLSPHGDLTYAKGDTFDHPRPLAVELEERGLVEIED